MDRTSNAHSWFDVSFWGVVLDTGARTHLDRGEVHLNDCGDWQIQDVALCKEDDRWKLKFGQLRDNEITSSRIAFVIPQYYTRIPTAAELTETAVVFAVPRKWKVSTD